MVSVSILGQSGVYAQQISDGNVPVIEMIGKAELTNYWDIGTVNDPDFRYELHDLFELIKNDLHFPDRQVCIVIPHEWLHYYVVPVDNTLSVDEQRSYLEWEFDQRVGSDPIELFPRFYPLRTGQTTQEILTIGLPENLLPYLQKATDAVHLQVETISIAPMALQHLLTGKSDITYFCRFTDKHAEVIQFTGQQFQGSGLFRLTEDMVAQLVRSSHGNSVTAELQSVLTDCLQGDINADVSIYGSTIPEQIQNLMSENGAVNYVNPFQGFKVNFRDGEVVQLQEESQYAEVVGVLHDMMKDAT